MSAYTILEEAAAKQGWNTDTQLELVLEYISDYQHNMAFQVFIEERVRNENDLQQMEDGTYSQEESWVVETLLKKKE